MEIVSIFLTPGPPSTSPAPPPASPPLPPRSSRPPAATTSSCASPWRSQLGSRKRRSFGGGRRRRSYSASSSCHSWRNESWVAQQRSDEGKGLERGHMEEKGSTGYFKAHNISVLESSLWLHTIKRPPPFSPIAFARPFPWSHTVMQLSGLRQPQGGRQLPLPGGTFSTSASLQPTTNPIQQV